MWIKYDSTPKLYKWSTDDGANWYNLALDAAQITQGALITDASGYSIAGEFKVSHATGDYQLRIGSYYLTQFYGLSLNYQIDGTGTPLCYLGYSWAGSKSQIVQLRTPGITVSPSSRPITIGDAGKITIKGDSGGWALYLGFLNGSGTDKGGFGVYGAADVLNYYFVGPSYDNNYMYWASTEISTTIAIVMTGNTIYSNQTSATATTFRSMVTGDSAYRFTLNAGGGMSWGPGNVAADCDLYRDSAGVLGSSSTFCCKAVGTFPGVSTNTAFYTVATGDTVVPWLVQGHGAMYWGPGNATQDTNLYRYDVGILGTDSSFRVAGTIYSRRNAVGSASYLLNITGDTYYRFGIFGDGALWWGDGTTGDVDTKFYRSAAHTLALGSGDKLSIGNTTYDSGAGSPDASKIRFGDGTGWRMDFKKGDDSGYPFLRVTDNKGVQWQGPSPWLDVKAFGAVGDGSTDDTTAIGYAVSALPASGGIIFFPTGKYKISSAINIDSKSVRLIGESVHTTIIRQVTASTDGIRIRLHQDSSTNTRRAAVENLWFQNDTTGGIALTIDHGDFWDADGCAAIIRDILITGTDGRSTTKYWDKGIHLSNCWEPRLDNIKIFGFNPGMMTNGIEMHGSTMDGTFTNIAIFDALVGIYIHGVAGDNYAPEGNWFFGCSMVSNYATTTGWYLHNERTDPWPGFTAVGCHTNTGQYGFRIVKVQGCFITNCLIWDLYGDSYYNGINADANCEFCVYTSNQFYLGGSGSVGLYGISSIGNRCIAGGNVIRKDRAIDTAVNMTGTGSLTYSNIDYEF